MYIINIIIQNKTKPLISYLVTDALRIYVLWIINIIKKLNLQNQDIIYKKIFDLPLVLLKEDGKIIIKTKKLARKTTLNKKKVI